MQVTYRITIVASWGDCDDAPSSSELLDVFTEQAASMIEGYTSCEPPAIRDEDGVTVEEIEPPGEL
jgi:hypothetical protein